MFNNPGRKIKNITTVLFVLSVIGNFIIAIIIADSIYRVDEAIVLLIMLLIIVGGSLLSYILCLFLYGFGEMIEGVRSIDAKTGNRNSANINSGDELKKYEQLYKDGIITEEEYNAKKQQLLSLM